MNGQSARLPGEAAGLLRRLHHYILFRWVAIGVALLIVLVARLVLNVGVPVPAMLGILGGSAVCNPS